MNDCEQILYELDEHFFLWGWKEIETPSLSPSALYTFADSVDCIEDDLFVVIDAQQQKQLWQLHLNAMTWTFLTDLITRIRSDPTDISLTLESSSVQTAVFYGSVYLVFSTRSIYKWIAKYNTTNYLWGHNDYLEDGLEVERPASRMGGCVSSVNSSTVILYGGRTPEVTNFRYLQDLWLGTLPSFEAADLEWTEVRPVSFERGNSSLPLTRTSYQCVVIDNTLIVMGG